MIVQYSATYAQWLCYGAVQVTTAAEAAGSAASPGCRGVPRSSDTGLGQSTLLSYSNQGSVSTSGVDFAINWRARLEDLGLASIPGGVVRRSGLWLDSYKTKASKAANFDPWIEWKGSLGPTLSGFDGGAYRVPPARHQPGLHAARVQRQSAVAVHLPSAIQAADAATNANIANNERVVASGEGVLLSYVPSSNQSVEAYDTFDLSASWAINDTRAAACGCRQCVRQATGSHDCFRTGSHRART